MCGENRITRPEREKGKKKHITDWNKKVAELGEKRNGNDGKSGYAGGPV